MDTQQLLTGDRFALWLVLTCIVLSLGIILNALLKCLEFKRPASTRRLSTTELIFQGRHSSVYIG